MSVVGQYEQNGASVFDERMRHAWKGRPITNNANPPRRQWHVRPAQLHTNKCVLRCVLLDTFPAHDLPSDAPRIRLCTLKKWADFSGYGFNLHAEKGKAGHFIGVVDENSPASTAGLQEGDKIIAVNGDNILEGTHQQVVSKIKSDPGQVRLLVLDPDAELYYRNKSIIVTDDMPNVDAMVSPDVRPGKLLSVSKFDAMGLFSRVQLVLLSAGICLRMECFSRHAS